MDLFIHSELGSASKSHCLRKMGRSEGNQREKRKMNQVNVRQKKKARKENFKLSARESTDDFQEVRNKNKLAVHCGETTGSLHRKKYDNGENCISYKGKWYSPTQFEAIGGKRHHKKWKYSIYYKPSNSFQQVQLLKLINNGVLPEFGHLKDSFKPVTQTNKASANSKEEGRKSELINALKGFPESWKRLFSKTVSTPVCESEENTLQRETVEPESSSDEPASVAERVKMKRRESVMSAETLSKTDTDPVGSNASETDSSAHPVAASELAVSPVVEKAVQTTADDPTGAGPLGFSASEWQSPVASEETQETRQLQLYELLTKQFNTINNTLQSIDMSLKKLVERQSNDAPTQQISAIPAVIENTHSLIKQEVS